VSSKQEDILKGGVRGLCGKDSSLVSAAQKNVIKETSGRAHLGSFVESNTFASDTRPPEAWTPVALTAKDILELDLAARLMSGTLSGPRGGGGNDTGRGAGSASAISDLYHTMIVVADRGVR
jgi:hypothetical protein